MVRFHIQSSDRTCFLHVPGVPACAAPAQDGAGPPASDHQATRAGHAAVCHSSRTSTLTRPCAAFQRAPCHHSAHRCALLRLPSGLWRKFNGSMSRLSDALSSAPKPWNAFKHPPALAQGPRWGSTDLSTAHAGPISTQCAPHLSHSWRCPSTDKLHGRPAGAQKYKIVSTIFQYYWHNYTIGHPQRFFSAVWPGRLRIHQFLQRPEGPLAQSRIHHASLAGTL